MKCLQVKCLSGHGSYIQPIKSIADIASLLDAELDGAEIGEVFTLTIVEMTEQEIDGLPKFTGW